MNEQLLPSALGQLPLLAPFVPEALLMKTFPSAGPEPQAL